MLNGPPPASMRLGGGRLCTRPAAEVATTRRATGTRELQLTLLALDGTTCNTGPPPLLCDPGWVVLPVVVEDMGQWDRRQKQQWEEENTHTHTHTHKGAGALAAQHLQTTPAVVPPPVHGEFRLAHAAVERHVVGHPERRIHGRGAHDALHRPCFAAKHGKMR